MAGRGLRGSLRSPRGGRLVCYFIFYNNILKYRAFQYVEDYYTQLLPCSCYLKFSSQAKIFNSLSSLASPFIRKE